MEQTVDVKALSAQDRLDIQQLMAEYSVHEDTGAAEQWAALYTRDGRFVSKAGKATIGHDALVRFAADRWENKPWVRQWVHWVSNVTVKPVEGGAQAYSYQMTVECSADGYKIVGISAKRDTLRIEDGRWRFHVRQVEALPAEHRDEL